MKRKVSMSDIEKYLDLIQSDTEEGREERERFAKELAKDQRKQRKNGNDPFGLYGAIRI